MRAPRAHAPVKYGSRARANARTRGIERFCPFLLKSAAFNLHAIYIFAYACPLGSGAESLGAPRDLKGVNLMFLPCLCHEVVTNHYDPFNSLFVMYSNVTCHPSAQRTCENSVKAR